MRVNASVPKTFVRHIVKYVMRTLHRKRKNAKSRFTTFSATPVSTGALPAKDGEHHRRRRRSIVGPYDLHDFLPVSYGAFRIFTGTDIKARRICFRTMNTDGETVKFWLQDLYLSRFFAQQFKRSCLPGRAEGRHSHALAAGRLAHAE